MESERGLGPTSYQNISKTGGQHDNCRARRMFRRASQDFIKVCVSCLTSDGQPLAWREPVNSGDR